jgi:nucleotide-binding universal stress UspA family protein
MKKILIAVDETKGSLATIETVARLFPCVRPETVILLYVKKEEEAWSLADWVALGDVELSALKETLEEAGHLEYLDKKARATMDYYRKSFEEKGVTDVKALIKEGYPADEILTTAKEEGVEMIILGSRGNRVSHFLLGSVSREVASRAEVSVLIAR